MGLVGVNQRLSAERPEPLSQARNLLDCMVQVDLGPQPPQTRWRELRIVVAIAIGVRISVTGFPSKSHTFAYKIVHKGQEDVYRLAPDIAATVCLNEPRWDTDSEPSL